MGKFDSATFEAKEKLCYIYLRFIWNSSGSSALGINVRLRFYWAIYNKYKYDRVEIMLKFLLVLLGGQVLSIIVR